MHCSQLLKKKRISVKNKNKDKKLYDIIRTLKGKDDLESKAELKEVMNAIVEKQDMNFKKLKEELKSSNQVMESLKLNNSGN